MRTFLFLFIVLTEQEHKITLETAFSCFCKSPNQGSIISPCLYLVIIDDLIKELKRENAGASSNNRYCDVLVPADDVALIANIPADLKPCSGSLRPNLQIGGTLDRSWSFLSRVVSYNSCYSKENLLPQEVTVWSRCCHIQTVDPKKKIDKHQQHTCKMILGLPWSTANEAKFSF